MAEIVEPGTDSSLWSTRLECPNCKALIRLRESDIKAYWSQANWGGDTGNWTYSWQCPSCNKIMPIGFAGQLLSVSWAALREAEKQAKR